MGLTRLRADTDWPGMRLQREIDERYEEKNGVYGRISCVCPDT